MGQQTAIKCFKICDYVNWFQVEIAESKCFSIYNDKALAFVTSTCYLGVLIDQHLTWKLHVANVRKCVRSTLYALYCLRPLPGHLLFRSYH